jgi:hypothetical protein
MAQGDGGDLVDRFLFQRQELGVGEAILNSFTCCVSHRSILPDHSRNKDAASVSQRSVSVKPTAWNSSTSSGLNRY